MKLVASAAEMRAIPRSAGFRNGGVSFWFRESGPPARRAPLPGSADYDVCVVGAGYTGLWTAYYLKKAQPDLRVAVVEREFAGFGAAGRNGGRLSAEFPGRLGVQERLAASHGKGATVALQRAMMASVDEVIGVAAEEGIDADAAKDGVRLVATNAAQRARLHGLVDYLQEWGHWPEDLYLREAAEFSREPLLRVDGALCAAFSPHAARIHPAKLAVGLAAAVEALGVDLFEDTAVIEIRPRRQGAAACAVTERGAVRAEHVLRATEGYTGALGGRSGPPARASMIATEPIGAAVWEQIGWDGGGLVVDASHASVHAQRTADDRIAIGGPGVPSRSGAAEDRAGSTAPQAIAELWRVLVRMFPAAAEVPVAHAWSGAVAVPGDGAPALHLDPATGLGWAGCAAGSGVTTANLAGRTLRDLVLGRSTELTRLPWAGREGGGPDRPHRLGAQAVHSLRRTADRREAAGGSETSPWARLAARIAER
ncbi:gamma-glutamylputrescine oxidase [Murinocardiopsis flavida]|uniref:Gamma-glutamylputrescine oxidase n=1 Tax=Murinocardiopsis flavida TaxID=645275 RepID=A0A2P8DKD6_9ACTN|nr:FAD-binding oxidoreductase [Murinocardiopsis flavida]PSK97631.1 gamma-glutamylputrescine oxidase [Murinocardiopsis flavida]